MMNQNNDTINAKQQSSNNSEAKTSAIKDEMTAKLLASAAVGLVAGAGATFAADHLTATEATPVPEDNDKDEEQNQEDETEPTVEERLAALEEKERIREEQEQANSHVVQKPTHKPEPGPKPTPPGPGPKPTPPEPVDKSDFFREHKVEISSSERYTLEGGETAYVYDGKVDGHIARFIDYGANGRIDTALIDYNDNGEVDYNERIELSSYNITEQQMVEHHVSEPEHEVKVLAVQQNADLYGETVDLAMVAEDGEIKTYVDVTRNGEVDVIIWDKNHNENFEPEELEYVGESHIPMPTEADIKGDVVAIANDDTEDYVNNGDVAVYEA